VQANDAPDEYQQGGAVGIPTTEPTAEPHYGELAGVARDLFGDQGINDLTRHFGGAVETSSA
jgi:hypothetical protein